MGDEAVYAAADLNDRLAALKAGVQGMGAQLAGAFVPVIGDVVAALQDWLANPKVQEGIKNLAKWVGNLAKRIGDFLGTLLSGDVRGALEKIFPENVVATIMTIATAVGDFVNKTLIPFIQTHMPAIKGAIAGIAAVLGGAGLVAIIAGIGAVLGTILSPIGLIVAAAAALGAAWSTNFLGIRDTLTAVWEGTLKPALEALWQWLQVAIPIAIEGLSQFWNNVLLPAIRAVGNFITGTLFPIFQQVFDWLKTVIPPAIQALSDFWQNVLLPAIRAVWSFIQTYLIPLFQALNDFIGAVLTVALQVLKVWWDNVLVGVKAVYDFLKPYLMPLFEGLSKLLTETLIPALSTAADYVGKTLKGAFDALKGAIQWVIDKVTALANKFKNLKVPKVFDPGSPTPFEMGLRGIGRAMDELARKKLPEMTVGLNKGPAPSPQPSPGGRGGGETVAYNLTIYTAANGEDLAADFRMMQALAKA
jgi:hypothetical protein